MRMDIFFLFLEGVNCEEQGNGSAMRLLTNTVGLTFVLGDYKEIDYLSFIFKLFNQTPIL